MDCPYCTSKDVVKTGKRYNKYLTKQRFLCKQCNRKFIIRDGFEGMTYPKEIITKVLHLYIEGLSLSKIRGYIYQHEGYYLHDSVILYWVRKYSKLLSKFEQKLKPEVKGRIHTDEVVVNVKGQKMYSINSIDSKSKYNLATTFAENRSEEKCREHFKKLYDKIGEQVKRVWETERHKPLKKRKLIIFVSDKFENYRNGFNYYFYRFAKLVFGVPIACKKYGLEHNNNSIERHNEDYKQRYKTMRCFKETSSASAFSELRRIVYNFVRVHQGIGKTPAEEAGLDLKLGRNKLLCLIFFNFLFLFNISKIRLKNKYFNRNSNILRNVSKSII